MNNRRTLKNTIRGYFKSYGIRLGAVSNSKFPALARSYYSKIFTKAEQGIEGLLKSYEVLCQEITQIEESLNEICRQDKVA